MKQKNSLSFTIFVIFLFCILIIWILLPNCVYAKCDGVESRKDEFVIATWNIGHFSLGKKPYSMINHVNYHKNYVSFKSILFDSINADVVCFNEYSKKFGIDEKEQVTITEDILKKEYANKMIGPLLGYSCNCIFSKVRIENAQWCEYEINKTVGRKMPRANKYYYVDCDLYLGKKKIKLICAHTINSASALCQSQIAELIVKYRKIDRVIMCGDWNTKDFSLFSNSGYTLANDGSFLTYTGSTKHKPIDNIVVKGMKISDVRVINSTLSDHNLLACKIAIE